MRLVAYPSTLYAFGLCWFFSILAAGIYYISDGSRRWLSLPFICIAALAIAFSLWGLVFRKPILTADDTGIHDKRLMKSPIPWSDIMAFRHVPRVVRPAKGQITFSPFDSWRPIHLWVASQKPTILTRLQALSPHPVHKDFPQARFIPIEFAGLDIPSSRFAEVIRTNAPNAKEEYS
ncbi:MAG: hypothetical protein WCO94_12915 [Verrucomicrobiota bacterium]